MQNYRPNFWRKLRRIYSFVFPALHGMPARIATRKLSGRPTVCQTRDLWQN